MTRRDWGQEKGMRPLSAHGPMPSAKSCQEPALTSSYASDSIAWLVLVCPAPRTLNVEGIEKDSFCANLLRAPSPSVSCSLFPHAAVSSPHSRPNDPALIHPRISRHFRRSPQAIRRRLRLTSPSPLPLSHILPASKVLAAAISSPLTST